MLHRRNRTDSIGRVHRVKTVGEPLGLRGSCYRLITSQRHQMELLTASSKTQIWRPPRRGARVHATPKLNYTCAAAGGRDNTARGTAVTQSSRSDPRLFIETLQRFQRHLKKQIVGPVLLNVDPPVSRTERFQSRVIIVKVTHRLREWK